MFWIRDIFGTEFGHSDVQANYSRVYSWMANQLGHVSLGLLTTFAFFWIENTAEFFLSRNEPISKILVSAGLVLAGYAILRFQPETTVLGSRAFRGRVSGITSLTKIGFIASLLTVDSLILADIWIALERLSDLDAALTITCFIFAVGIFLLSKDQMTTMMGFIAITASYVLSTGIRDDPSVWAVSIFVAFLPVIYFSRPGTFLDGNPMLHRKSRLVLAFCVLWFLTFLGFLFFGFFHRFAVEISAVNAAVAFWWVKEFGMDLPLVCREIHEADAKRKKAGAQPCVEIENQYYTSALWDARTDGAFYVAGAILAGTVLFAILSEKNGEWLALPAFFAVVVCLLAFLILGRLWAYRQAALDGMKAPIASRLAVFWHKAEFLPDFGFPKNGQETEHELGQILSFANGTLRANSKKLSHLLVFGARNSGKSSLGLAIASECALADLQPHFSFSMGRLKEKQLWRTSTYRPFAKLAANLRIHGAKAVSLDATLVVLDDVYLTAPADLQIVLDCGFTDSVEAVVWLISSEDLGAFNSASALDAVRYFTEQVAETGRSDQVYALEITS